MLDPIDDWPSLVERGSESHADPSSSTASDASTSLVRMALSFVWPAILPERPWIRIPLESS